MTASQEIDETALVEAAMQVRQHAYAPYSDYRVGAALWGSDGTIYPGCNVENASYGLTICAERAAIATAVGQQCRQWLALAVATADGAAPCGACLQVLAEFAEDGTILLVDDQRQVHRMQLSELLPRRFPK